MSRSDLDLSALQQALAENELTVLSAPPGTGKTTRVPLALLQASWLGERKILVLEPRRLAARRAAQYMASLLGERPGETVGWQVRAERCIGPRTRVEFLTEGLLARRILDDPELSNVGCILFDEFHERSLALDVSFALAREVREGLRPDLRLLVMSATVAQTVLPEARFIEIPAQAYPVDIRHLGACTPLRAIQKALQEEEGSILCFLPGEGEIRRVEEELLAEGLPAHVDVAPLYAAREKREQDFAVAAPAPGRRKIVLATSIAESSLTIEGVRVVVDTGLARVPKFSPRNGLTRLVTQRISLDRAIQRTGRAGRLCAGVCYRLWTAGEELTFVARSSPEILDADLTQVALLCAEWGSELQWLTPPPPSAWVSAQTLLRTLKAFDSERHLTPLGREMARFPVHPALASMMLQMRTIDPGGGALLAAICSEGEKISTLRRHTDFRRVVEEVLATRPREIWQLAERWAKGSPQPRLSVEALVPYLLLAFPGHLAHQRDRGRLRYLLAAGFGAELPPEAIGLNDEWLMAVRMSDNVGDATLRWVAPLSVDDLSLCSQTVRTRIEWEKQSKRLLAVEEVCIGAIVLKRRPLKDIPPEARVEAERCRLQHEGLPWTPAAEHLAARMRFLHRVLSEEGWPTVDEAAIIERLALAPQTTLEHVLQQLLVDAGFSLQQLEREAPSHFVVPSGSRMRIHYEQDNPYVAVKIQEVFGLKATPRLAKGRVPVVLHLLSPAQRPVQVTSDLASFWTNGYAIVRKDMRGRYPKHYWPEDPTQAEPSRRTLQRKS